MIRYLANIHDPISRMLVKLLVDFLSVVYVQPSRRVHWIGEGEDVLETNPRFKLKL